MVFYVPATSPDSDSNKLLTSNEIHTNEMCEHIKISLWGISGGVFPSVI